MLKTKSYIDSRIGQYIHATLNMWIPYWTNTAQLQGQLYPQLYPQLHASCTPAAGQLHAQLRLAPSEAALSTRGRRMRRRSAVSSPPSPGRHDVVSSHQMPPRIGTRPSCQLWASSCTWLNPARWPTRHHQRVMCPDVNMGCTNHLHDCLLHVFLTNHHRCSLTCLTCRRCADTAYEQVLSYPWTYPWLRVVRAWREKPKSGHSLSKFSTTMQRSRWSTSYCRISEESS